MYFESDLVRIAKRENNKKRSFLIVNPLQGKHIPMTPSKSLELFNCLAEKLQSAYPNEKLLIIGFAETATAISTAVAIALKCPFILTTREYYANEEYLFFSEEHSHATEQRLIKKGLIDKINSVDRIIFIDDEISSGKTILNLIKALRNDYSLSIKFSVASLINGMDSEHLEYYKNNDISVHYILKTNQDNYSLIADNINPINNDSSYVIAKQDIDYKINMQSINGYINARYLTDSVIYDEKVKSLWNQFIAKYDVSKDEKILILGTEEFMYPAMFIAKKLEDLNIQTKFHATTRSPIVVSNGENYPLQTRYQLTSFYDNSRTTYLYNILNYDRVFIITDSKEIPHEALSTIYDVLEKNCTKIDLIQWRE